MTKRTVVDLFSGAGGTALGFKRTNLFRILAAVEIDQDAALTYEHNIGVNVKRKNIDDLDPVSFRDELGLDKGERLDVLMGCPPCQGFTRLRNKAGASDERNRLVLKYLDFVSAFAPKFVVFENVPGFTRTAHGKAYHSALVNGLRELGYAVKTQEVDAADYGVPQHRRRVIVFGAPDERFLPTLDFQQTHGAPQDPRTISGDLHPWRTVRQAIGNLPPLRAGERHEEDSLHYASPMGKRVYEFITLVPKDGGSRMDVPRDHWLQCHQNVNGYRNVYGRMAWDTPSNVITGGCGNVSRGRFVHPEQNRGISLREAALLQGFPEEYQFFGKTDSVRRQIGNAVPPPLAEATAREVHRQLLQYERAEFSEHNTRSRERK